MNRVMFLLVLTCAAASVPAADKQQVYKWTDANGVVHFSDAPPPTDTKNVESLHLAGGTTTAAAAADRPNDAVAASSAASSATSSTAPPNATDDATLCKQSRANLELLQGKTPVGIAGADGKAQVLDDKAREIQIASAKLSISRFCK
jgi:hypothetical protein